MSNILKGLNENRSSWDSNMPGYQGDYGGEENWGRRNKASDENEKIDDMLRQQNAQRQEYEKSGKFWLKLKDSQRHLPAGPFMGKASANAAAIDLLKKQPELKGNLLITAYGPDEKQDVAEAEQVDSPKFQSAVSALKQMAKQGERQTVWDPVKRVYKTVPVNQPKEVKEENLSEEELDENLRKWFKEKWVRFGPDGKIRGACARGDDSEGKPKCLPQSKAHALGKKGRKYAASKKRREDPNPERRGPAKNVATKKKSNEGVAEGSLEEITQDTARSYAQKATQSKKDLINQTYRKGADTDKLNKKIQTRQQGLNRAHTDKRYYKDEQGVAEEQLDEACWKGYHKEGMKTMFGKKYPNCVKNTNEEVEQKINPETVRRLQQLLNKKFNANLDVDGVLGPLTIKSIKKFLPKASEKKAPNPERTTAVQGNELKEEKCPECGGPMFSDLILAEKKDACYHKVRSRYKVWPSAYASGALVQCRKKGAANWGTGGKKNEDIEEGQIYSGGNKPAGMRKYEPRTVPSQDELSKKESAIMKGLQLEGNDEEHHTGGTLGTPYPGTYEQETLPYRTKGQKRTLPIAFEDEQLDEKWSEKYKRSIDCSNPKGFSQKAHCQGRKK